MSTWYEKYMPKIKDISKNLPEVISSIKKINGVKSIYAWGSYAENIDDPNFRVRDLDIIIKTHFNSGDLIAITNELIHKEFSDEFLEREGYDPEAVRFSKKLILSNCYNLDRWAISEDNKLMHWGPIVVSKTEADCVSQEAEEFADKETGKNRHKISKSSEKERKSWYQTHYKYLNNYFSNMPTGWYQSGEKDIKEILKKAIKL